MAQAIFAPLAEADLRDIYHFIGRDNHSPAAADRLVRSIRERCSLYASQPELGERRPDLGPDLRVFVVRPYVVVYRPITDGIDVIRVVHGQRDYPALFR